MACRARPENILDINIFAAGGMVLAARRSGFRTNGRSPRVAGTAPLRVHSALMARRLERPTTCPAAATRHGCGTDITMQRHKIVSTIAALVASAGTIVALGGFTRPVDQSQAKTIAIKACGGGTIKSESDGGMRNGDKVYTFDVNVANKSFVEKVNVDAKTGAVLDVTYAGQQA